VVDEESRAVSERVVGAPGDSESMGRRERLEVPKDAAEDGRERLALASERTQGLLDGRTPRKVIVVAGRLVNFVVQSGSRPDR
jgi:leucyl-tRNA synthetase